MIKRSGINSIGCLFERLSDILDKSIEYDDDDE